MQTMALQQQINVESIKGVIASKIDSAGFATWIAPLQFTVCQNCLHLVAQNQFTADYVRKEYGNVLKNIAADFRLDLDICVKTFGDIDSSANDNVVPLYFRYNYCTINSYRMG